ncbi:MAG: VOC family protein [Armatimonadota bacterium]|nr:VOC family protein [Armatimonadota bacterium]MDR7401599.1 VOC family protein [Armatimonadota bacterium]MDR7405071.1 VOC family protein [Armatimonadota bacterium]MDR7436864.1 VOC family protein [Armatimonadota bacterium]MDR7471595.1 VOC family protein [Armatimonadota bacterium]
MLDQLLQVSILVSDMKKAFTFYSYVLGLPVITRSESSAEFRTDGVVLAIKPRTQPGGTGTTQMTFQVADLEVAFNDAKRRGAKVLVPPRTVDGGRMAQLADPDGNIIELFEPEA